MNERESSRTFSAGPRVGRAWPRIDGSIPARPPCTSIVVFRDNVPIAALLAAYIAAVYGVHAFFGIRDRVVLVDNLDWFARFVLTFSAIFIGVHLRRKAYLPYFDARSLTGFLVVVVSMPLFRSAFASFKQTIPLIHPFEWDPALMRLDRALHFGHHPWELLRPILARPGLLHVIDSLYLIWFPVLFAFCLWMGWTQRRRLRLHFFVSTVLVWGGLGSVLGAILSSGGPCFYAKLHPGNDPFAPLMSRLNEVHQTVYLWGLHNQAVLWDAYRGEIWLQFGGISAMPSMHLGMATVFALAAWNVHRLLGVVFAAYLCVIQVGSVVLGWHYAVDGYVAMILTFTIWKGVGRLVARCALEDAEGVPRGTPSQ